MNVTLNKLPVRTLQCPSFSPEPRLDPLYSTGAAMDYASPARVSSVMTAAAPSGFGLASPPSGVFDGCLANSQAINYKGAPKFNRVVQFADGVSNTIMLYELGGRPDYYVGMQLYEQNTTGNGGWAAQQATQPRGVNGDGKWSGFPTLSSSTTFGPAMINVNSRYGMYSLHTNGANVAMSDGAVRFLRDSVDAATVIALVTRSGGEVLNAD